jgi:hypothetical protein
MHLVIQVKCNTSEYAFFDNTFTASWQLSNKSVHFYRLPVIESGGLNPIDEVVVYTGKNSKSLAAKELINKKKNTKYRIFRGLGVKIWNKDHDKATVVKIHAEHVVKK